MGASLFYGAITLGRLLAGFVANRLSREAHPHRPVRLSGGRGARRAARAALRRHARHRGHRLGTSPIYPSMLHDTPRRFGAQNSQAVVGLQMAFAYVGSTLAPPLFGSLASLTTLRLYPWFAAACTLAMLAASETVARKTRAYA